ncbi:DinB family protein [Mucilaginibacter sp. McL0603]|uniref:DinB family protein n=1 Tax=Mucilaginibacter sp. McL0603 TaxID=3415670 RepID=UPI003CE88A35
MENNLIKQQSNCGFEWFITSDSILNHWQGHRRLTRQVIESFPEDKLFKYSVSGMHSFSTMVKEMICIADSGIQNLFQDRPVSEPARHFGMTFANTKEEILNLWDDVTYKIDVLWPLIPQQRFHEVTAIPESCAKTASEIILSWIDNEIHHRAHGYLYLRSLKIELPFFRNFHY